VSRQSSSFWHHSSLRPLGQSRCSRSSSHPYSLTAVQPSGAQEVCTLIPWAPPASRPATLLRNGTWRPEPQREVSDCSSTAQAAWPHPRCPGRVGVAPPSASTSDRSGRWASTVLARWTLTTVGVGSLQPGTSLRPLGLINALHDEPAPPFGRGMHPPRPGLALAAWPPKRGMVDLHRALARPSFPALAGGPDQWPYGQETVEAPLPPPLETGGLARTERGSPPAAACSLAAGLPASNHSFEAAAVSLFQLLWPRGASTFPAMAGDQKCL